MREAARRQHENHVWFVITLEVCPVGRGRRISFCVAVRLLLSAR
jgi:hypothetical protein